MTPKLIRFTGIYFWKGTSLICQHFFSWNNNGNFCQCNIHWQKIIAITHKIHSFYSRRAMDLVFDVIRSSLSGVTVSEPVCLGGPTKPARDWGAWDSDAYKYGSGVKCDIELVNALCRQINFQDIKVTGRSGTCMPRRANKACRDSYAYIGQ